MPPYCFLDQDRTLGVPDREKEIYVSSQRPGMQTPGWRDDQVDVRIAQEACQWLRGRHGPFFCYLPLASPHYPCVPPAFLRGASRAGSRGDAVCLVDWVVGQVLDTLAELGTLDDTLVIWGGEFGRTPMTEGTTGRDHNPHGFSMWLAGGGAKRLMMLSTVSSPYLT